MKLNSVTFLAAETERSGAYAAAMAQADLYPSSVIFFGDQPQSFLHDIVSRFGCPVTSLSANQINNPLIHEAVAHEHPQLIIYSGYGGQIVGKNLLRLGPSFLHIHSGWLPEYRGSTTIYYSLLQERSCGVSAILLAPEIDMGRILMRRRFPPPPPGQDVDHSYDNDIRARVLVETLQQWQRHGEFVNTIPQKADEGTVYYVIHPVLKHAAILSL